MLAWVATFNGRLLSLSLGMMVWSGLIFYKLVDIQIFKAPELRERSETLHKSEVSIPAKRGDIIDCNGKLLAISQVQPSICADPSVIEDPKKVVDQIAKLLGKGKDRKWKRSRLARLSNKNRMFAYLERWVAPRQWDEIKALKLKGVFSQMESTRKYPKDWTASHVIGFVSAAGEVKEGAENWYDEYVAGRDGRMRMLRDGRKKRIWLGPQLIQKPVIGSTVRLSIDENIQFFVENAVRRGMQKTKASNITAIVMDPTTGAIKAMANMPDFNPNRYRLYQPIERKNRAIVDVYEPASAFKIITVAAALEHGSVALDTVFDCENGGIRVHRTYIRDHKPFAELSVEEILWHSSNVGAIKIAQTLPETYFASFIRRFGFGTRTGIDLPAEAPGIVHPVEDWSAVSQAFLSIGHEISVTPLQMLCAASVVANGGYLVQPHIGESVHFTNGEVHQLSPARPKKRVISADTAAQLRRALTGVVRQGTAKLASIPGLDSFGKTGTAQRIQGRKYSTQKFNASFVGFFPATEPRYGIIVVVHDPKMGKVHGGEVAAPIFSEIGSQIALYESDLPGYRRRRVPMTSQTGPSWPSPPFETEVRPGRMPKLTGMGLRQALNTCADLALDYEIRGKGKIVQQKPAPGSAIQAGQVCRLTLKGGG